VKLNPGLQWKKHHSTRRLSFISKLGLNLSKILLMSHICSIALYGAETLTLQKGNQKHLESLKSW
jgi:hypothetical protein